MKGDFSRFTFRPSKGYTSVRMQQGRVSLDSDWNEQVASSPDSSGYLHASRRLPTPNGGASATRAARVRRHRVAP
jgi:hypothetical protein